MKNSITVIMSALILLGAFGSHAKPMGLSAEIAMGFNGETEADKLVGKKGITGERDLDDDDLEKNMGASIAWHTSTKGKWLLGIRAGTMKGETEDLEAKLTSYDLGFSARYRIPMKSFELQLVGVVGPSLLETEIESSKLFANISGDSEFGGFGYHVMVGIGFSKRLNSDFNLVGGLYFFNQGAEELAGEHKQNGTTIKVEIEDVVSKQFLITAGLSF